MEQIFGTISFIKPDKGFGFIAPEDGEDVFFHATACQEDFTTLRLGQRVSFVANRTPKGMRAEDVALAS